MLSEKEIKEKVKNGWIRTSMMFEVLGTSEEIVKKALEEHIAKLEADDRAEVYMKKFYDVEKIEGLQDLKEAYSQVCEVEILVRNFENLVNLVLFYGPSACEILEPERIEIPLSEAQSILNTLGGLMHRLSQALGGIIVKKE
jgi:hypothetical protein